jgi:hypothetical protein
MLIKSDRVFRCWGFTAYKDRVRQSTYRWWMTAYQTWNLRVRQVFPNLLEKVDARLFKSFVCACESKSVDFRARFVQLIVGHGLRLTRHEHVEFCKHYDDRDCMIVRSSDIWLKKPVTTYHSAWVWEASRHLSRIPDLQQKEFECRAWMRTIL